MNRIATVLALAALVMLTSLDAEAACGDARHKVSITGSLARGTLALFLAIPFCVLIEAPILRRLLRLEWRAAFRAAASTNANAVLYGFVLVVIGIFVQAFGCEVVTGGRAAGGLVAMFPFAWIAEVRKLRKFSPETRRWRRHAAILGGNAITYPLLGVWCEVVA